MYKQGCSQKMIARAIGKDKSVICRELKRNANAKGRYTFEYARDMSEIRKERAKRPRKMTPWLKRQIIGLLERQRSPRQIRGRLELEGRPFVSHETIYKMICEDKKADGSLYLHMRHSLKKRKRHHAGHIPIRNRLGIEERPDIVNLKKRFGDWEMDTIIGENGKGAMVTLVERTTAFSLCEKLPHGKNAKELTETVYRMLLPYKDAVHTITVDNGSEFADHQRLAKLLGSKIYFTHPYSSWEKGLIEYTQAA